MYSPKLDWYIDFIMSVFITVLTLLVVVLGTMYIVYCFKHYF